jgi:hypothetical protein
MTKNPSDHSEQISAWQILDAIKSQWRWYVIGTIVGGVLGFVIYLGMPLKYEATVALSPARVGSITAGGLIQGVEPEPANFMVERFKQPNFYTEGIRESCGVENTDNYQQQMSKSVAATILKSTSLIKVTLNGPTPAVAQDCMMAIVAQMVAAQAKVSEPVISKITAQTKVTKELVDKYTAELANLDSKRASKDVSSTNFNQIVIADKAAQNLREALAGARRSLTEEEVQLLKPYTQPVLELEPIYVSRLPLISLKLAIVLGGFTGLFLSIFGLLLKLSYRNYRAVTVD